MSRDCWVTFIDCAVRWRKVGLIGFEKKERERRETLWANHGSRSVRHRKRKAIIAIFLSPELATRRLLNSILH